MTKKDILKHYGVLGMRWGRKKGDGSSSGKSSKKQDTRSEDYKVVAGIKKKKISEMSNAELQTALSRLNAEKQYRELNKSRASRGKSLIESALSNAGKKALTTVATAVFVKALQRGLNSAFNK